MCLWGHWLTQLLIHGRSQRKNTNLEAALSTKDKTQMRAALDAAEDLDMAIDVMDRVKEATKEHEAGLAKRASIAATLAPVAGSAAAASSTGGAAAGGAQSYDAAEEACMNFPNLLSSDDSLVVSVAPKLLTEKDSNKSLWRLTGMRDKQLPFLAMLAQDILRKRYEYKSTRGGVFLLIVKQLTNNPRSRICRQGLAGHVHVCGPFPPSTEFENFLLHYIIEKRDREVEAMLTSGDGTGFVPFVEEILVYKERPPIPRHHLPRRLDGNVITENLPLTPDLNVVGKVLEMCSGWLDLKDPRINTLGMFVYDLGELDDVRMGDDPYAKAPYADLKRTPRPLRNEDYMGDTIVQKARQRRKFKFVLKRKIFLPKFNYRGDDPFFERMTYLQAEDEAIIQGNIEMPNVTEAVHLAAMSMAVAFGEDMPATVEDMVEGSVVDFVPPDWRDSKTPEQWAALLLQHRETLAYVEPDDLQEQFLQVVQKSPAYGSHWFYAHKLEPQSYAGIPKAIQQLPYDLMLAFNAEGMHIYNFSRQSLLSFPYSDICRWGGSSSQFSLIMADDQTNESYEFVLITSQAADMAAIILDHIRAIMAEQDAE
eukprot:gene26743-33369_t